MSARNFIIAAAVVLAASPAAAQQRGTVEFGGFVGHNAFTGASNMNSAIGGGGRIGAFLHPRWSLEVEGNGGNATRQQGLADRSFRFLDARVLFVPTRIGRASLLVGGGAGHVDAHLHTTQPDQHYGYHALLGAKIAATEGAAVRLDGVQYFRGGASLRSIRLGLSLYRQPMGTETTVFRTTAAPARADSVSAAETRRMRAASASYTALRDSLARNRAVAPAPSSAAALATMLEMINFERDASDLDDISRAILRDKVPIFNANPDMRIVITGFASSPGTEAYNMALGFRRATAAKTYLVSQGVASNRIEISTRGENALLVAGPGEVANAANRRGQFRLLIADPYLAKP